MSEPSIGVLFNTDRMKGEEFVTYAQRLDASSVDSVWLAELFGREPFAAAANLLARTERIRVGTAIANIYARDAVATAAAARTLAEQSGNRFELGLGVSNRGLNSARGHEWTAPAPRLAAYLDALESVDLSMPEAEFPVHVAAHGPKMLEVAAARADGVFTYLMNPEHTARTRAELAETAHLNPMMMCLLCEEPDTARALIRKALEFYMGLDYYHRAWRTLGFDDSDFADGGSDRLLDAIVAWGSIDDIQARIQQQGEAGASRVVVIPLNAGGGSQPDWNLLDQLGS